MKRWLAIAVATIVALAAVTLRAARAQQPGNPGRLRVVHAASDAPAVDVAVNNSPAFCSLAFRTVTRYVSTSAGFATATVTPVGGGQAVINTLVNVASNTDYTLVVTGQAAAIEPLLLTDDNSAPPAGQAKVRFVHASPNTPSIDVVVRAGPVLFTNVPFRGVGSYVFVGPGGVELEVRQAGTDSVLLAVPGVVITPGVTYTIHAVGLLNGRPPLTLLISVDSVAGTPAPSGG